MPKLKKFETQVNWLWYEAEITDEQAKEWKINEENSEFIWDLDWELKRDKPGNDDVEYTLIESDE